jgi:hypothetical protein
MKQKMLIAIFVLVSNLCFSQSIATNFNCNDCAGSNHDLFTELNAGKIVVLCWVMPCSSCISPSRTAYDVVQTYTSSQPGRVLFYLVDDYANTPCNTLTTWGNNNGMPNAVKFSNAAINPADYGIVGMPKIVIVGGVYHKVYYNENDGANTAGIQPAIDLALSESGIDETNSPVSEFNLFPNPIQNSAKLTYTLKEKSNVSLAIINVFGETTSLISSENQTPGEYNREINYATLSNGVYFLRLAADNKVKIMKVVVSH